MDKSGAQNVFEEYMSKAGAEVTYNPDVGYRFLANDVVFDVFGEGDDRLSAVQSLEAAREEYFLLVLEGSESLRNRNAAHAMAFLTGEFHNLSGKAK